jgi:hypothetical protein
MTEQLQENWLLVVAALLALALAAWWIIVASRRTKVQIERTEDDGAPARRNQALIDAPPAAPVDAELPPPTPQGLAGVGEAVAAGRPARRCRRPDPDQGPRSQAGRSAARARRHPLRSDRRVGRGRDRPDRRPARALPGPHPPRRLAGPGETARRGRRGGLRSEVRQALTPHREPLLWPALST